MVSTNTAPGATIAGTLNKAEPKGKVIRVQIDRVWYSISGFAKGPHKQLAADPEAYLGQQIRATFDDAGEFIQDFAFLVPPGGRAPETSPAAPTPTPSRWEDLAPKAEPPGAALRGGEPAPSEPLRTVAPTRTLSKDGSIIRQTSYKCAAEVVAAILARMQFHSVADAELEATHLLDAIARHIESEINRPVDDAAPPSDRVPF